MERCRIDLLEQLRTVAHHAAAARWQRLRFSEHAQIPGIRGWLFLLRLSAYNFARAGNVLRPGWNWTRWPFGKQPRLERRHRALNTQFRAANRPRHISDLPGPLSPVILRSGDNSHLCPTPIPASKAPLHSNNSPKRFPVEHARTATFCLPRKAEAGKQPVASFPGIGRASDLQAANRRLHRTA